MKMGSVASQPKPDRYLAELTRIWPSPSQQVQEPGAANLPGSGRRVVPIKLPSETAKADLSRPFAMKWKLMDDNGETYFRNPGLKITTNI
jgi:hypothetical protein